MGGSQPISRWARATFGDLAEALTEEIPACLVRAHHRAKVGQQGVHTQTLEAYGHGLHAVQYEELATGLEHFPDALPVRLSARTVMVIRNNVIYPIRYAKSDVPVTAARLRRATGLRAQLIRRHGPEPMQGELDLGLEEETTDEVHADLTHLDPDVGLVLVAYACSLERGLMRLEWGEAELRRQDRYLVWHHHEPLRIGRKQQTA